MEEPLISCIITSYQREKEIVSRAVTSVINQTLPCREILIIDDNRGEGARVFSEGLSELTALSDRIRVIPTEGGHGAQKARNTGIRHAGGRYLAFLDDDDAWLPRKLEKQAALLEAHPEVGMCYCNGEIVDLATDPPKITKIWESGFHARVTYEDMLRQDYIGSTSQAMVRKEAFEVCGSFDEALPARQDYEMWIRLSRHYPLYGIDEPLFRYYRNSGVSQLSHSWKRCMTGHDMIYRKYRADIDRSRAARFNIVFHRAHYYMMGRREEGFSCALKAVGWYIRAFFTSPALFWEQGKIKLRDMKK